MQGVPTQRLVEGARCPESDAVDMKRSCLNKTREVQEGEENQETTYKSVPDKVRPPS